MAVLNSLLSQFRASRPKRRKTRQDRHTGSSTSAESLESRMLLTNIPNFLVQNAGAAKTVYLDFDGHGGTPAFSLDATRTGDFSQAELQTIEEIFLRVSEDFAPFGNVEIRAADPEPTTFSNGEGIRVVIGAAGRGITVTQNDFGTGAEPNVVTIGQTQRELSIPIEDSPTLGWDIAYRSSRAIGRAMGLDYLGNAPALRRSGLDSITFATGDRDIWSDTAGQDDLAILTNTTNGLTFRADDHGNSVATATAITVRAGVERMNGVIQTNTDTDWFRFSTAGGTTSITVNGLDLTTRLSTITGQRFGSASQTDSAVTPNRGTNLDPIVNLYDANGVLVAGDTTLGDLTASVSANLVAGTYFIEVSNAGQYGSLGQYTVELDGADTPFSLSAPSFQSNPLADVRLFLDFNGHIVSNDEIVSQRADGIDQPFYVPVYDTDGDKTNFSAAEEAEMEEIFRRVAEDFAPFDVNVTTFDPFSYANEEGLLIAIGGDGSWLGAPASIGPGFVELDTFNSGDDDNNAITFAENLSSPKEVALEASAYIAASMGIERAFDYSVNPAVPLAGQPAFGPIGGDSVNSLRDIFMQVAGASNPTPQDPLAEINSAKNRIVYRADDHGDSAAAATPINVGPADEVLTGIIGNADEDWFSFNTLASNARIDITGLDLTIDSQGNPTGITNPGANLDPIITLFADTGLGTLTQVDIDGDFPAVANPNDSNPASLKAGFNAAIPAGRYYLRVSTRGEYGNMGQYTVRMQGVDGTPAVLSFQTDPNDPNSISIAENAGVVVGVGHIARPEGQPSSNPLVVSLVSTDTTEVTVPAQVTIPAGQDSVTFNVTAVDDNILDGDQNVRIEAYVSGVLNSTAILKVTDHETITSTVAPNPVREDAGKAGVSLTVTRSNTDIGAVNHWVTTANALQERDPAGNVVRTLPVEWPAGIRPTPEIIHDVHVMQDGSIAVFNGTTSAFLSVYNTTTLTWRHFTGPGLSGLVSSPSIGGITSVGDYVFLTDSESFNGDARGIVRVNTLTGEVERFADKSVGSRMFVLATSTEIVEVDPVTGEQLNSLRPAASVGSSSNITAITYDGAHLWVLYQRFSSSGTFELQKLDADSGDVVEVHAVPLQGTSFFFGSDIGMTSLNGRLYFNTEFFSFSGGFFFGFERSLQTYNPATRQMVGGAIPIESLNSIFVGSEIGSLKGDGTTTNPDVLLFYGDPDNFGTFNDDRVFMLDPVTGRVFNSFGVGATSSFGFVFNAGIDSLDDVAIGNTTYNGLIYLNLDDGMHLFDRRGVIIDAIPATANPGDPVPYPAGRSFPYREIAGADVPGVTAQDLSFRDVSVGITDGLLYGLVEDGLSISVYDPETLFFRRTISLDTRVNSISVDEDGNILAGGPNGGVRMFNNNGTSIAVLDTSSLGLASVVDVDTNISEEVLITDVNGLVITGSRDAVLHNDAALLQVDNTTTGNVSFAGFGRHNTLPTGPLVVQLSSSDVSELTTPLEVTIPVGQSSVTVDLDVVDDNILDGSQTVTVSSGAPNYVTGAATVTVQDAESVGVDVLRDSIISILDPSLVADGDQIEVTVNNRRFVFEIADTAVGDGISARAHYAISMDLTTSPSAVQIADAVSAAIAASNIGVTSASANGQVTLSGNPYYPSVNLVLGNINAARAEKPIAENEGLLPNRVRVYRTDIDGPFTVPGSTGGAVTTPRGIADNASTLSRIQIEEQVTVITDVDIRLSLTHQFVPDLDIALVSPNGTRVVLQEDLASNEANMTNTVFDDEAAIRLIDGTAPYTGRFIPKQLLSKFDGENPSGRWTLEVVDDNFRDTGVLLGWSLDIKTLGISETRATLVTTDSSEATITSQTVVIPAGRSEVFVDLAAQDDNELDGTIQVDVAVDTANVSGQLDLGSDTIDVTDVETLTITLDSQTTSEGAGTGAINGTITRSDEVLTSPLTVSFTSSDTSELSVPSPIVIPAGQSSASFTIDAVDDLLFDGDQSVTITATANGYTSTTSDPILVTDQEPRLVLSTLTPAVAENAGTITISLSRLDANDLSQPQQVRLESSDVTELTVPTTFVIGVGQISTSFTATILEDVLLDGDQTVTITASDPDTVNPSVSTGTLEITVQDAESLSVTVPAGDESFLENAGADVTTATVTISSEPQSNPITVVLHNGDDTELSIPSQVVIPAGETSATFSISAVNDDFIDRDQLVAITASASGYRDGVLNVTVGDHEPPIPSGPAAVIENSRPTMTWEPVGGATRYDLWVNDLSRGINQLFRLDNLPADQTSFTPNQAMGVGRYRFWVRAYDDLEQPGFWSSGHDFRIRTRPSITSPVNQSIVATTSFPEISWTTVVDTDSYDLWVNNLTTGESQVIREMDLQTTSYASGLASLPGGTYKAWTRARVQDEILTSRNNNEPVYVTGFWSRPVTFTVLTAPNITRPEPATFDRTPTIEWDAVEGATNYFVWVTQRNPGETPVVVLRDRFVDGTTRTPETDLEDGRYVVWVKAIAADGTESQWSAAREFTIGGRPELRAPLDESTTSRQPEFAWTSIEGAARYEIWINRTDVPQTRVVHDTNVPVNAYSVTEALAPGRYRVWVRAVSDMGEASSWSLPIDFNVAAGERTDGADFNATMLARYEATTHSTAAPATRFVVTPMVQQELPAVGVENDSVAAESTPAPQPSAVTSVTAEVVADVDTAMVDNVLSNWAVESLPAPVEGTNDQSPLTASAAAAIGFGLTTRTSARRSGRRRRRS